MLSTTELDLPPPPPKKNDLPKETHVGPVDGGRPPEREPSVGDLVETRALGIGQLLPLHGFLKAAGFFPETKNPPKSQSFLERRTVGGGERESPP